MRTLVWLRDIGLLLSIVSSLASAAEPTAGDVAIERFLKEESSRLSDRELAGATSKEQWESRRKALQQQYLDMLGLWPLPDRTPLQATVTGTVVRAGFSVEKVHFQSRPGLYVTANLYLPRPLPKDKLPAVLYVCGHSGRGRDGNKTAFQHHGMWFATHGYACLLLDSLQLGEVAGIHHGTYNRERWWWHAAGYTPAGVECWNGVRGIDYLVSRPEVDAARIAVTGISGGGAATLWITAADERVKVCVPVSGHSDLQSYVDDKVINGHCDCMFFYNTYRWEWTTIAALIAPRPMLFENSGHDTIFPMPGNERIRARLERLYGWYQRKPGELFDIGVTPGGHDDNVELRLMAYRWINRHLQGDNAAVNEPVLPPIAGHELRAFPEDRDLPRDSVNDRIDELFIPVVQPTPPTNREQYAAWSRELHSGLADRVFREWPDSVPAARVVRQGESGEFLLATQRELTVQATLRPATAPQGDRPKVWLIVLNADESPGGIPGWAKDIVPPRDRTVVLSPRGSVGELAWTRTNPPNYVERSHALLGRSVDVMRVWDVQSAARWIHEAEGGAEQSLVAVGRGAAGVLGAYAALHEPAIAEVVLVEPPVSHRQGPMLLNVLRVLDVPDALGLLAPRQLTVITGNRAAFERTQQIYSAAGYADRSVLRDK